MSTPKTAPSEMLRSYRQALIEPVVAPHKGQLSPWEESFRDDVFSRTKTERALLNLTLRNRLEIRDVIARACLKGRGIELGAQNIPTRVDSTKATVQYADRMTSDELASRYSMKRERLVKVDYVIDGSNLEAFRDGSIDFLIANHVLEHFDDPVGGVVEWLRVIADGGQVFLTVPNHRGNSFDYRRRPPTRWHFGKDHADSEYRSANNRLHYGDLVQSLYQFDHDDPLILATADAWTANGDKSHYHVYDEQALRDVFALAAQKSGISLRVVGHFIIDAGFEYLLVVEKSAGVPGIQWPEHFASRWSALSLLSKLAAKDVCRFYLRRPTYRASEEKGAHNG